MMLSEFKAWFEGYTEGLEGAPTKAQFERIKEKVKEISGTPVTQTIFLDSYRRYFPYYDYSRPYWTSGDIGSWLVGTTGGIATSATGTSYNAGNEQGSLTADNNFDGHAAMYALGKAESLQ